MTTMRINAVLTEMTGLVGDTTEVGRARMMALRAELATLKAQRLADEAADAQQRSARVAADRALLRRAAATCGDDDE